MSIKTGFAIIALALVAAPLASCGSADAPDVEGDHDEADVEEGPNGGRMLRDGDFALEITIFEDGVPPQYRVYATRHGEPVAASEITLTVTLKRLGGKVDRFAFRPQGNVLVGQGVVEEPHSFDVEVVAVEGGRGSSTTPWPTSTLP